MVSFTSSFISIAEQSMTLCSAKDCHRSSFKRLALRFMLHAGPGAVCTHGFMRLQPWEALHKIRLFCQNLYSSDMFPSQNGCFFSFLIFSLMG